MQGLQKVIVKMFSCSFYHDVNMAMMQDHLFSLSNQSLFGTQLYSILIFTAQSSSNPYSEMRPKIKFPWFE